MNEEQIKDLINKIYKIADNHQFEHDFDLIYYQLQTLAQNTEYYLKQKRKYITYVDCQTFKSNIETLKEARDWQLTLGGKIYMETD